MRLRPSTSERLEAAFAEAAARGDFEAAEGWLATARYVSERDAARETRDVQRETRLRLAR